MTKVLVSGYIGFNNFGDEAIFKVLSNHLKTLGFDVSVLCNNKKLVRKTYNVKTYNYKKPLQIIKAILSCDILISGGGSLLQNKTSNKSLVYYLLIIFLSKLFLKKVLIFAQGIEPVNGAFFEFLLKTILKRADYICVRDQKSVDYLNKLKINSTLNSDPVYSLVESVDIEKEKTGLVVQLRDSKNLSQDFLDNLALSISRYYRKKVSVFCFEKEIDEKVCLEFVSKLKKHNIDCQYLSDKSILETIEVINKAEFLIGMRLHSLICAVSLKTKPLGIIYDEKIKTLACELNLEAIDLVNYSNLDSKISDFFNNHSNKTLAPRSFNWECIDSFFKEKKLC